MKNYIFRNYSVEHLFIRQASLIHFSHYNDCKIPDEKFDIFTIFFQIGLHLNINDAINEILQISNQVKRILNEIESKHCTSKLEIFVPQLILPHTLDGNIDGLYNLYNQFIGLIYSLKENRKDILVLHDLNKFQSFVGKNILDDKYYYAYSMIINPALSSQFSTWLNYSKRANNLLRSKLVIVDFDNTIWRGVLGEDGILGVKCQQDTYEGRIFNLMQRYLKNLSNSGVLLAGVTKNNETDIQEIFDSDMLHLKREDFFQIYANWEPKSKNIKDLVGRLNIGYDAVVFIDDNPVERMEVIENVPNINVPEFPSLIDSIPYFITKIDYEFFSVDKLLDEDISKKQQYINLFKADQILLSGNDSGDYLNSLSMKIRISEISESNIDRVVQMTQKTNQFNSTTTRFDHAGLECFRNNNNNSIYCLYLSDKFGDHGLTSVIFIRKDGPFAYIELYLMSCRILARGIEKVFLKHVFDKLKTQGCEKIYILWSISAKNSPFVKFINDSNIINMNTIGIDANGCRSALLECNFAINHDIYEVF